MPMRVCCILLAVLSISSTVAAEEPPTWEREWCPQGTGDGQCDRPRGVAVGPHGEVYVADTWNNRVQKFDSSGQFLLKWGSLGTADGQFDYCGPGIGVDPDGFVYVVDGNNHRVQKFDADGSFVLQWATRQPGVEMDSPFGLAVDRLGHVFVSQYQGPWRIQKYSYEGAYLQGWGVPGSGPGEIEGPLALATDAAGNVYLSDCIMDLSSVDHVSKFTGDGVWLTSWGGNGTAPGYFRTPFGIGLDAHGEVYVVDHHNQRIQKFTGGGEFLSAWGHFGDRPGEFSNSHGLAVDAGAETAIYILDWTGHPEQGYVQKYTYRPSAVSELPWSRLKSLYR